jgi:hypothetical protein
MVAMNFAVMLERIPMAMGRTKVVLILGVRPRVSYVYVNMLVY